MARAVISVVLALLSSIHNSPADISLEGVQGGLHMPGGVLFMALHEGSEASI